jgi:hypothetical protein
MRIRTTLKKKVDIVMYDVAKPHLITARVTSHSKISGPNELWDITKSYLK